MKPGLGFKPIRVAVAACLVAVSGAPAAAFSPPTDADFNGGLAADWSSTGTVDGLLGDNYVYLNGSQTLSYSFNLASATNLDFSFWYSTFRPGAVGANVGNVLEISIASVPGNLGAFADGVTRTNAGGGVLAQGLQGAAFLANNPGSGGLTNDAQYFTAAPIFLAAGDYQLTFANQPGLLSRSKIDDIAFSAQAVPEPETWAMLFAGLGVVGFLGKRRRERHGLS